MSSFYMNNFCKHVHWLCVEFLHVISTFCIKTLCPSPLLSVSLSLCPRPSPLLSVSLSLRPRPSPLLSVSLSLRPRLSLSLKFYLQTVCSCFSGDQLWNRVEYHLPWIKVQNKKWMIDWFNEWMTDFMNKGLI